MSLISYLEDSEDYSETDIIKGEEPISSDGFGEKRTFVNNIGDRITLSINVYSEQNFAPALFYFEIDDQPYYLESFIKTEEDLKEFKRDGERFAVDMINKYNDT